MPTARSATAASRRTARPAGSRAGTARTAAAPRQARPALAALRAPMLRVRWDRAGRIALLLVFAAVVGIYAQRTMAYLAASSQSSREQAVISSLARQNRQLAAQQQALGQPATIVHDARELGMARPGELPYVILGHNGR